MPFVSTYKPHGLRGLAGPNSKMQEDMVAILLFHTGEIGGDSHMFSVAIYKRSKTFRMNPRARHKGLIKLSFCLLFSNISLQAFLLYSGASQDSWEN